MVELLKIRGKSVIDYVTSITSEQCIEDDSCIHLELIATIFSKELEFIVKGISIELVFSAYNGFTSKRITGVVQEVSKSLTRTEYKISVKALNKGTALKNNTSKKVYKNHTLADIVRAVANSHGLIPVITSASTKVWTNVPQSNRSDFALLQYLVVRDGGNDLIYCDNDSIYFAPIGTTHNNSGGIFDLNADNNELISLNSSYKTYHKSRKSTNISTSTSEGGIESFIASLFHDKEKETSSDRSTYDGYTGKKLPQNTFFTNIYKKLISNSNIPITTATTPSAQDIKGNTVTAANVSSSEEADDNGEFTSDLSGASLLTSSSQSEANSITSSAKNKRRYIELDIVVVGNPKLRQNTYIVLKNIGNGFDGRWFIDKIKDTITSKSYTTTLTLTKIGHIYKDKNRSEGSTDDKNSIGAVKDNIVNSISKFFGNKDAKHTYNGYDGNVLQDQNGGFFTEKGKILKTKILPNATNISSEGTIYGAKNIKQ